VKRVRLKVVGIERKMISAPRHPMAKKTTITARKMARPRLRIRFVALSAAVFP
jgi:hypothetical protein